MIKLAEGMIQAPIRIKEKELIVQLSWQKKMARELIQVAWQRPLTKEGESGEHPCGQGTILQTQNHVEGTTSLAALDILNSVICNAFVFSFSVMM